jgi:hypothetical protein
VLAIGTMLLSVTLSASADTRLGAARCAPPALGGGCSSLSAFRGRLLWSDYQPEKRQYVLLTRVDGSETLDQVPVPGRLKPFEADLGKDASGHGVAVYSRCKGDPSGPARGCAVFAYDFAAARERRLALRLRGSRPLLASIWGARLAVVTRRSPRSPARVQVCRLPARGGQCRQLPGGPLGAKPRRDTGATAIDLQGRRAVFAWFYLRRSDGSRRRSEILLVPDVTAGTRARLIRVARASAGGAGSAAVYSPSIDRGGVYWARGGQTCDFPSAPNAVGRYDVRRRRGHELRWSRRVQALAHSGSALYAILCGSAQPPADSMVARVEPNPFSP